MITARKAANALSGKTARACDGCSRKRARWFCSADDAFLCQACDVSVHSANQLASRHERVRLQTASFKISGSNIDVGSAPAWHQGFTRKARTPRVNGNKALLANHQVKHEDKVFVSNLLPLVPEITDEEGSSTFADEDDDQLLYRVPVFDPFAVELCTDDIVTCGDEIEIGIGNEEGNVIFDGDCRRQEGTCSDLDNLPEFLSSDMDLAEFAADVENLLGLDEDSTDLGVLNCKEEEDDDQALCFDDNEKEGVKVKDEQEVEVITGCDQFDRASDIARESIDWSFDYEWTTVTADDGGEEEKEMKKKACLLRLNYEAVINAWEGCPWTSGTRPQFNPDDWCLDSLGSCPKEGEHDPYGGRTKGHNEAREARVMRYKEKRRTRLFSKKIRYEVRKLNAEKRPRMKGRFVKRASLFS